MNKRMIVTLLLCFAIPACLADEPETRIFFPNTQINIPNTLKLGDENWILGNKAENGELVLAEYIFGKDNINNWTRLFTIQLFKFELKRNATTEMFTDAEISPMQNQGYNIKYTKIKMSKNDGLIEFQVKEPVSEAQDELQRVIISPDKKLTVIHYVVKKVDMGQSERKKWIDILANFNISILLKK